jgi:NitT/TauT family transport system permease protein
MKFKLRKGWALPWLTALGMFAAWEIICRGLNVPDVVLPPPSVIAIAMYDYWGGIWFHAEQTLFTTLAGFGIAVVVGLGLGIAVGASPTLYRALNPILIGFNSLPKAAVVPIFIMWFGIGTVPAILTAFLISFFPIAVNVATGIATLEPELQDVLRSLGASRRDILIKVGLPRSMPYFFASLKVAITLAFVGSVISETVASNRGIGSLMLTAQSSFRVPLMFAGLMLLAFMGVAMYVAAAWLERRMTSWSVRGGEGGVSAGGG